MPGAGLCVAAAALAEGQSRGFRLSLVAAGIAFALALPLWRAGREAAAGRVVLLSALAATALVLLGDRRGFASPSMMLLPVLGIAANLLLPRREALAGVGAALLLLGAVLGAELRAGGSGPGALRASSLGLGYALVLVAVPALVSRLLVDGAVLGAERLQANERALALANECLEAEAGRREALIRELEARNAELERFCYTISHDLKSPLVTIGGFLGLLERSAATGDRERLRSDMARIDSARAKMLRLLDDLLDLSRAGRKMRPFADMPFAEVVHEARELCEGVIRSRGARVIVASDLPVVRGDRLRLVQLVQNLLDNAIKYSDGEAPLVEVAVRRDALKQVLFVRDHGVGIDAAYHERVFELFEKLGKEGEGSGVGLALARRIVESHGGRIWVESEGHGHGSTFCFTLPRAGES